MSKKSVKKNPIHGPEMTPYRGIQKQKSSGESKDTSKDIKRSK